MRLAVATVAIALGLFSGVASLIVYADAVLHSRKYRSIAASYEAKGDVKRTEAARGFARILADQEREHLPRAMPALVSMGLGAIMGAVWLAIRLKYGKQQSDRPAAVRSIAAICSTGLTVLLIGFGMAVTAYLAVIVLVLSGDD